MRPTFATDLVRAHQLADVAVMVGLVFRRHRGALGMSQRAYAQWRGWSKGRQGRLEGSAGDQRLDGVLSALQGTGYRLALVHHGDGVAAQAVSAFKGSAGAGERTDFGDLGALNDLERHEPVAAFVAAPTDWGSDEFVAKDEAGRKFPAHRRVKRTTGPPLWWMFRYSTSRGIWPEWTTAE